MGKKTTTLRKFFVGTKASGIDEPNNDLMI